MWMSSNFNTSPCYYSSYKSTRPHHHIVNFNTSPCYYSSFDEPSAYLDGIQFQYITMLLFFLNHQRQRRGLCINFNTSPCYYSSLTFSYSHTSPAIFQYITMLLFFSTETENNLFNTLFQYITMLLFFCRSDVYALRRETYFNTSPCYYSSAAAELIQVIAM